jgi:ATP-dependent Lon protease
LDNEHYGMAKIKNRILEYLAVLKLKGDMKSPILCLLDLQVLEKLHWAKA